MFDLGELGYVVLHPAAVPRGPDHSPKIGPARCAGTCPGHHGLSFREAATAVRVGIPTVDATSAVPTEPWFRSIGLAVTAGTLTAAAADAIRTGLGETDFQYTLILRGPAVRDIRSSPNEPVNITTVEWLSCIGLTQMITLNGDGSPLDVGRE